MMHRDFKPLDVMQDFLLQVIQDVPEELIQHVESLRNVTISIRHELETLERLEMRCEQTRKRLRQEIEYLTLRVTALADTTTKATVIEPLAVKLRGMVGLDVFGDLEDEQNKENDGPTSDGGRADLD